MTCSPAWLKGSAKPEMERVSQLILRNQELFRSGQILLINPPRDTCFARLAEGNRKVSLFSQDFGNYSWFETSGADVEFGLLPTPASTAQDVVLILPRERARLDMMLHALASSMPPESFLWLAGENRSGIKSSAKRLSPYFQSVSRVDNARHCTLFKACNPSPPDQFDLECYKKSWSLAFSGKELTMVSLPGTFAHGKLDKGTRLLLDFLVELKPSGGILDFACGNSVIGLSLLSLHPAARLTLLDVSALALESTRRSLAANGMEATVLASDGLSGLEGSFDWIISNPPFHRGIRSDLEIAKSFFADAGNFLTETGKILLVCNHHLPYPAWLKEYFTRVELVRKNREFKVVLASGPLARK
jgi:16S rRNA (guanine1207-N2)-methyltransferase